jgi:hypothetical protein
MLRSKRKASQYEFTIVLVKFKCVSNTTKPVASCLRRIHRYAKRRSVLRTPELPRQ